MRAPWSGGCVGGWTWRPAWSAGPGCCTWTSRPTGLDPRSRQAVWQVVAGLASSGVTIVAAIAQLGRDGLPWVAAALVLYLVAFAITIAVNVPLNDGIKAAGDPDGIADLAAVRTRFNEARWRSWNLVRVVTSTAAFGLLAWALVLYGQST
jgi:hypothetical protein